MPDLTPEELLQIHKDYADEFASIAQSGLAAAFSALSNSGIFNYTPTGISIRFPDFGTPNAVGALPTRPENPKLPNLGQLTSFKDIPNSPFGGNNSSINLSASGSGIGNPPTYTAPQKPEGIRSFTDTPPDANPTISLPALPPYIPLPSLTLPFNTFSTPTKPVLSTPTFDGKRPADLALPSADTIVAKYSQEVTDHRALLTAFTTGTADALIARYCPEYAAVRARINNAIVAYTDLTTGGGVGIPANIEGAILARAADRNNLESTRAVNETATSLTKKGWVMPGGALQDSVRQAAILMGDAQVKSSTDVATKNLELEQQHFEFMFKIGETLEEKMMDQVTGYLQLAVAIDAQAINSAKELVAAYIGAYNLQVLVYRALWEGYQADAEVLKARIQANEALVRQYEAEISAEKMKAEVNNAYVGILQAVASVNQALASTYKAQVDGALAPLEVARVQVALFEAKARGYAAEVSAYEARWRGYTAEVEGNLGVFKGYEAQVQGFVAQVQATKAQIDAYVAQVNAAAATNTAIGQHNESVVRVFSSQADVAIKNYEGLLAGYTAESNVIIKQSDIEVEYWRTKSNLIFQEFNVAVQQMFEYAREQMNLFRGQMEAAVNAANGLAHASQVAGNLAGGAMQGLTTFAGILESKEAA